VGRFDETEPVQEYLDAAGIVILEPEPTATPAAEDILVADADQPAEENGANGTDDATQADPNADENMDADFVEGRIQIDGVGELERGGSTLFYRYQDGDRNVLIILSANPDTNADAFSLLMDDELSTCTVGEAVAVCQTESPGDKEIPSIRSTRVDKILVVGDDEGRPRLDDKTSEAEFESALGDTYKVTTWLTSADGRPTLDELQEYDAVVWTTGDYWDDSLDTEDADLLTNYIEAGGNLILSGASIAFDWDHTEFLENIVHTDYLTFAQQQDIEVASEDHPIARDFALGDVITLTVTEVVDVDPVMPDVVTHTPDARVIFRRGPDSEQPGAPTVIAYEDDRAKVAYYAFPVYELPEEARNTLLMNTVDWFTRKPLDLPDKEDYEPFQTDDTATVDVGEEPPADEGTPPADGETPPADDTGNGEDNGTGDDNGNDSGNGDQNTTQNGSSN
jgi:hypothetical protein